MLLRFVAPFLITLYLKFILQFQVKHRIIIFYQKKNAAEEICRKVPAASEMESKER